MQSTIQSGEAHTSPNWIPACAGMTTGEKGRTAHAWENQSDAEVRMLFFHIDAEFSGELRARLPEDLPLMK